MREQLVCRPGRRHPVAVLRVSGVLDAVTGDALRRAVRRLLSGQPEALVIDVADLQIRDPAGLVPVGLVMGPDREWPAVPVTLCGPGPAAAAAVAAWPGCAEVSVAEDCARAVAAAAALPAPPRAGLRLRPVPAACRQARQLVEQVCAAWQLPGLAATAALLATELVANVVRHAHTTMDFTVGRRDGLLCLAVRDGSPRLPAPADPGPGDVGGRGLRLIRDLSQAWGVLPLWDGKVVWTRLTEAAA